MAMSLALGITLGLVPQALAASSDTRDPRLGPGGHTTYALWRTTAGPNTISVNIGTPPTTFGVIPSGSTRERQGY
jgi:hypothetical protein